MYSAADLPISVGAVLDKVFDDLSLLNTALLQLRLKHTQQSFCLSISAFSYLPIQEGSYLVFQSPHCKRKTMEFDATETCMDLEEENPDALTELFASEVHQLPSDNFLHVLKTDNHVAAFHQEAISLIWQTDLYKDVDPFVLYLAAEYINRFISRQKLQENMPWVLHLLVVSSLSLALKAKSKPFSLGDLQRNGVIYFDSQAVRRMELLILDSLDWRLRVITPFSFVHFLLNLIEFQNLSSPEDAIKNQTFDIIFKAQPDPAMLRFQPSTIAGAAVLSAAHELSPLQFSSFMTRISSCQHIDKKKLIECLNKMLGTLQVGDESTWNAELCVSTPTSVLEHH